MLFGIEWQPPVHALAGLTIFADGAVGEDDYESVLGGMRFYFGESGFKSLKRRHREDDPDAVTLGIFNALSGGAAAALETAKARCKANEGSSASNCFYED